MAASDRAEEYQEKYNEAVGEIDELRTAYETIKSEYEALSQKDKDVALDQEKILDAKAIVGKTFDFQLKGHAQKLLALRQGIVHRARLDLHILRKVERNVYEVELPEINRKCFMALVLTAKPSLYSLLNQFILNFGRYCHVSFANSRSEKQC